MDIFNKIMRYFTNGHTLASINGPVLLIIRQWGERYSKVTKLTCIYEQEVHRHYSEHPVPSVIIYLLFCYYLFPKARIIIMDALVIKPSRGGAR